MAERCWDQPLIEETIFHALFIWVKSMKQKHTGKVQLIWQLNMCFNANERMNLEDSWLIKFSFIA